MSPTGKGSGMKSKAASGRSTVAEVILAVSRLVALVIVVGILLIVLDANPANAIVEVVSDAASFLVGPFEQLFTLEDRDAQVGVNYGIAAIVYLVVGRIVAGLVRP